MSSGLIVALEFGGVIGLVLGLAVWELLRLRRDRAHRGDDPPEPPAREAPSPPRQTK